MPEQHYSKQFDSDLEEVRSRVLQMGGLVEAQLLAAFESLASGSAELMEQVIRNEHRVNEYEVSIDDSCVHLIARRQPTAVDLRLIMAISKVVTNLERIGDEAAKIARMARSIYDRGRFQIPRFSDVQIAGDMAVSMLRRILDSLARFDVEQAKQVIADDQFINERFHGILRHLITHMIEDPRTISTAIDIVWIAKAIERVGDHAKNIAEQVIYIVHGTDVRHTSKESQAGGLGD